MEIFAALAADLALLTAALDDPRADIADAVHRFGVVTRLAVPSYLGLSVIAAGVDPPMTITVMTDEARGGEVRASLRIPLSQLRPGRHGLDVAMILYAAAERAFVDLAADLARIIDRKLGDVSVDEHLVVHDGRGGDSVRTLSMINQAVGVLLSRGLTPEQAHDELDARAAATGTDRAAAAAGILAELDGGTGG